MATGMDTGMGGLVFMALTGLTMLEELTELRTEIALSKADSGRGSIGPVEPKGPLNPKYSSEGGIEEGVLLMSERK